MNDIDNYKRFNTNKIFISNSLYYCIFITAELSYNVYFKKGFCLFNTLIILINLLIIKILSDLFKLNDLINNKEEYYYPFSKLNIKHLKNLLNKFNYYYSELLKYIQSFNKIMKIFIMTFYFFTNNYIFIKYSLYLNSTKYNKNIEFSVINYNTLNDLTRYIIIFFPFLDIYQKVYIYLKDEEANICVYLKNNFLSSLILLYYFIYANNITQTTYIIMYLIIINLISLVAIIIEEYIKQNKHNYFKLKFNIDYNYLVFNSNFNIYSYKFEQDFKSIIDDKIIIDSTDNLLNKQDYNCLNSNNCLYIKNFYINNPISILINSTKLYINYVFDINNIYLNNNEILLTSCSILKNNTESVYLINCILLRLLNSEVNNLNGKYLQTLATSEEEVSLINNIISEYKRLQKIIKTILLKIGISVETLDENCVLNCLLMNYKEIEKNYNLSYQANITSSDKSNANKSLNLINSNCNLLIKKFFNFIEIILDNISKTSDYVDYSIVNYSVNKEDIKQYKYDSEYITKLNLGFIKNNENLLEILIYKINSPEILNSMFNNTISKNFSRLFCINKKFYILAINNVDDSKKKLIYCHINNSILNNIYSNSSFNTIDNFRYNRSYSYNKHNKYCNIDYNNKYNTHNNLNNFQYSNITHIGNTEYLNSNIPNLKNNIKKHNSESSLSFGNIKVVSNSNTNNINNKIIKDESDIDKSKEYSNIKDFSSEFIGNILSPLEKNSLDNVSKFKSNINSIKSINNANKIYNNINSTKDLILENITYTSYSKLSSNKNNQAMYNYYRNSKTANKNNNIYKRKYSFNDSKTSKIYNNFENFNKDNNISRSKSINIRNTANLSIKNNKLYDKYNFMLLDNKNLSCLEYETLINNKENVNNIPLFSVNQHNYAINIIKLIIQNKANKSKNIIENLNKILHDFKSPLLVVSNMCTFICENIEGIIFENKNNKNYNVFTTDHIEEIKYLKSISDFINVLIIDLTEFCKGASKNIINENNCILKEISSLTSIDYNLIKSIIEADYEYIINKTYNSYSSSNQNQFEYINIRELVSFVFGIFKFRKINDEDKKNVDMFLKIDDNIPEKIYCIDSKLKRILINLLSNAYKFTIRGSITLNVFPTTNVKRESIIQEIDNNSKINQCSNNIFKENANSLLNSPNKFFYQKIRFEVIDTGEGLSKDEINNLFVAYKMLDKNKLLNNNGSGLGLCIVKDLLKLFNSELLVESKLGKGTKFYFEIYCKVTISTKTTNNDYNFSINNSGSKKYLLKINDKTYSALNHNFINESPKSKHYKKMENNEYFVKCKVSNSNLSSVFSNKHSKNILNRPSYPSNFNEFVDSNVINKEKSLSQLNSTTIINNRLKLLSNLDNKNIKTSYSNKSLNSLGITDNANSKCDLINLNRSNYNDTSSVCTVLKSQFEGIKDIEIFLNKSKNKKESSISLTNIKCEDIKIINTESSPDEKVIKEFSKVLKKSINAHDELNNKPSSKPDNFNLYEENYVNLLNNKFDSKTSLLFNKISTTSVKLDELNPIYELSKYHNLNLLNKFNNLQQKFNNIENNDDNLKYIANLTEGGKKIESNEFILKPKKSPNFKKNNSNTFFTVNEDSDEENCSTNLEESILLEDLNGIFIINYNNYNVYII